MFDAKIKTPNIISKEIVNHSSNLLKAYYFTAKRGF